MRGKTILSVRLLDEREKLGAGKATVASVVIAPGTERLRGAQELVFEVERHTATAEQPGCLTQSSHFTELTPRGWLVAASH
jgi:hypothetical protein